jgi:uncharacterized protein YjbI with pentapeptide repeats
MSTHDTAEIEEIKSILIAHQHWLRRRGGRRADLSFRDLAGLDLRRATLIGAKMAGANLAGTRLATADLSQTDLFGADLERADLTGANLSGADLRGANLHRAILTDAVMRGADFRAGELMEESAGSGAPSALRARGTTRLTEARMERSILTGANFAGCDLSGADLNDADLTGAVLSSAVLLGTDLTGATLDGANFGGTVIDHATLSRTFIPFVLPAGAIVEPRYTPMDAAAFLEALAAHEAWVEQQGHEGARLDLDLVEMPAGLDLAGRVLAAARLRRCRLPGARLAGADLQMTDLSYAELEGADLAEADLRGATLRRAVLRNAGLARAVARPLMLSGGRPWPANFDGADLSGADLRGADLAQAIVRSARLDGARLEGSGLTAGDAAPPRPAEAHERRRQKRYVRPVIVAASAHGEHRTRNWSIGGLCLQAPEQPWKHGELVDLQLTLTGKTELRAEAQVVVVHVNRAKEQVSVRFQSYRDELKALLKTAFLEYQKLVG